MTNLEAQIETLKKCAEHLKKGGSILTLPLENTGRETIQTLQDLELDVVIGREEQKCQ